MQKAIFISGGASGIGRAVAQHFAARGWRVGLGDVNGPGMAETLALLAAGPHSVHHLDVREPGQWADALSGFAASAGRIDVLFNNAGVASDGPLVDIAQDEIDRVIDVNFRGVIHGARAVYPWLRQTAPGSVLLNTASVAGIYGCGGFAAYSATKFAVRGITEALDSEWAAVGIKVCSLMPGFIDTPLLATAAHASDGARTRRDAVVKSGLEFTPVEQVAKAAWDAVHGKRLHVLVGKTARRMGWLVRWTPGLTRRVARRMASRAR